MSEPKQIGIWMNHSIAQLIEPNSEFPASTIASNFTQNTKELALQKGENKMHSKEQEYQHQFYKAIGNEILKYHHVLLFGPTNAKTELNNILSTNHHFDKIKIDVQDADDITDNQKMAFIKQHFSQ